MVSPSCPAISIQRSSCHLSHFHLISILYHQLSIDNLIECQLLLRILPVESSMSSWSGDSTGSSIGVVSQSLSRSFCFVVSSIVGGGLIDVPILLSINASNTFRFFSSTGLCILAVVSGHRDRLGTTRPLALRIHWAISLPLPRVGPRIHPSTSQLWGKAAVCSQ